MRNTAHLSMSGWSSLVRIVGIHAAVSSIDFFGILVLCYELASIDSLKHYGQASGDTFMSDNGAAEDRMNDSGNIACGGGSGKDGLLTSISQPLHQSIIHEIALDEQASKAQDRDVLRW